MCGISIIISPENKIDEHLLKRMNDSIKHRGPNGEGFYIDNEIGIGLGHRRLSIIDLSDGGSQPMSWKDKYIITYNGEIYNYIELREELISLGYQFTSQSDTEVVLAAYDKWGTDCFAKFNGMWAMCIYDKQTKKAILCRDRFGVKPLYYFKRASSIYASSEIRQLLATGLIEHKPNYEILMNFLVLSLVEQDQQTFFDSVFSLAPSHYLIFDFTTGKSEITQYYFLKIKDEVRKQDEEKSITGYHELIRNSIKIRLRSDVKVGTCLSGGLDSSYIASVASAESKKNTGKRFFGITASSIDEANNEVHWAKMVAEKADLDWNIVQPSKEDFKSKLMEVVNCQEEPFTSPSVFMQHFVMQKASELDCTVLLDGQGGDETLLGYERYYMSYLNGLSLFKKIKAFKKITENSKLNLKQVLQYYFYFNKIGVRKLVARSRHKNIKIEYFGLVNWSHLEELTSAFKNIDNLQHFEITKACLPHLLKYEDRNSMWYSIEARIPFIDYRLVDYALSIKPTTKIKNGWTKYVLRKGSADVLPEEIIWRKNKYGFESPDRIWLSDKVEIMNKIKSSKLLCKVTNTIPEQIDNLEILWRYYSVALWEEQFEIVS